MMDYERPKVRYFIGLDVGRTREFTALAVLEKTRITEPNDSVYAVRHLQRFAAGTPYTAVADEVVTALAEPMLRNSVLVVDVSAVGLPFLRLFRNRDIQASIHAVNVTNGHSTTEDIDGWLVPKKELVTTLQLLLQSRRLHVAASLEDAPVLARELAGFSTQSVSNGATDRPEWRELPNDDLVFAVAIAAWLGDRWIEPYVDGPLFLSPMPFAGDEISPVQRVLAEMEWED